MNTLVQNEFNVLRQTNSLRALLFDVISDTDLEYRLLGDNLSLGELCQQLVAPEKMYINSFKTFRQDFSILMTPQTGATNVAELRRTFNTLDAELEFVISGLSQEDVENRRIDRGWQATPLVQLYTYREGVLIFCAKASLYLKALQKTLPQQWSEWIG